MSKHPCWITTKKDADPFKPREVFCRNISNEGTSNLNDKTLLGSVDSSCACMKTCMKECEKIKIK